MGLGPSVFRRWGIPLLWAGGWVLASSLPVAAHSDFPLTPRSVWRAWSLEPWTLLPLLLVGGIYIRGVAALWRSAGPGRGVSARQVAAFGAGWLALVVALVSPLDALSEVLFSAHMGQHLLLMVAAPPLIVYGMPPVVPAWAIPRARRRPLSHWWHRQSGLQRLGRVLCRPAVVWGLHAGVLWIWHMPLLYDAALHHEVLHLVEHLCFFGTALLFWWTLMRHGSWDRGKGRVAALLFVFTTALHSGLLGALITFAARPLYANYAVEGLGWGVTPLEDQQLAGVVMWFPMGLVYLATILTLLGAWLHEADQEEAQMHYRTDRRSSEENTGQATG